MLPDELEAIILHCLAKEPRGRPASAGELRTSLAEVRTRLEDSGRAVYLPVAPVTSGDAPGRITLVEGNPRIIAAAPTRMAHALDVPLVGREEHKSFLLERAERVQKTGHGSIVILEGATGVGKTRLASWFKEHVLEQGDHAGEWPAATCATVSADCAAFARQSSSCLAPARWGPLRCRPRVASQLLSWTLTDAPDAGLLIQLLRPPEAGHHENPPGSGPAREPVLRDLPSLRGGRPQPGHCWCSSTISSGPAPRRPSFSAISPVK